MKFLPDKFLCFLILAIAIASIVPISGALEVWFSVATKLMVGLLFFLHGAKLSRQAVISSTLHWRLHIMVFATTFIIFPFIGFCIGLAVPVLKESPLYTGFLYLCILPSTIQSSIAFTAIAGGNIPAAIISASLSNILGLVITPLWAFILFDTPQGVSILSVAAIESILFQLFLPFLLGQVMQRWIGNFIQKHRPWTTAVDRISIIMVVYLAFCQAMNEGLWRQISWHEVIMIIFIDIGLLAFILTFTWYGAKFLHFRRTDRITITFCGSKKSLAAGAPMANALFASMPGSIGTIILPLMLFHQIQLIACSIIARALSNKGTPHAR
ncbi:bile acid:sodium symporter family protein [Bartonella sp. DGB2]|uniref:bile acid:sodium symporter family protein n=1 Tax=Bartonella sp. DGB2 TaxID=3388426 RepID=UPI00398FDE7F